MNTRKWDAAHWNRRCRVCEDSMYYCLCPCPEPVPLPVTHETKIAAIDREIEKETKKLNGLRKRKPYSAGILGSLYPMKFLLGYDPAFKE